MITNILWGGLGKNKYIVVSPTTWFNLPELITSDLYKDEWIMI